MTATSAGQRIETLAGPGHHPLHRPRAVTVAITATALVGLALRLYQLSRPGCLFGVIENDDGTYFGSAVRLIHGWMPYRDFIMVHPTGITVLMTPVALATRGYGTAAGMAVARVLTAVASAASVPLAGLIIRHRGLLATVVTCGILAVFPNALDAARTLLLEPWLVLFCLLGALAMFDGDRLADRSRVIWGGLAFGFAGAVKVWAVLPVVVILVLCIPPARRAVAFAAAVAVGFCVPVLPFALLAPATFYRSVFVAQLARSDAVRVPLATRLAGMLGLSRLGLPLLILLAAGAAVLVAVTILSLLGARISHQQPPALDWFATITCALVIIAFLWPPDFYYHYSPFLVPFMAMAVALPLSRVLPALSVRDVRVRHAVRLRRYTTVLAVLTLAAAVVHDAIAESRMASTVPVADLNAATRAIPRGACVLTDEVSYTIAINRFVSSVAGCPTMVDSVGSDYALSGGRNGRTGAGAIPAVEQFWLSEFRSAQYLWLTDLYRLRVPWTPQLRAYFLGHFVPLINGPAGLYTRKEVPQLRHGRLPPGFSFSAPTNQQLTWSNRCWCSGLAEGGTGYLGAARSYQARSDQMAVGQGQPDHPGAAVWIDTERTCEFLPAAGGAQIAVVPAGCRARVHDHH